MAVALAAVVVVCLRLGWWQLRRFETSGSFQNLGYTLQWPTFAVFAVVVWWRLRTLERERRAAAGRGPGTADGAADAGEAGEADGPTAAHGPGTTGTEDHPTAADGETGSGRATTGPATAASTGTEDHPPAADGPPAATITAVHEDEPNDELAAYNRYLAELNAAASRRRG